MKKKILVFFDQDIVIRAFYQSGTIKKLEKFYDITYIFPVDTTVSKKYLNVSPEKIGFKKFENVSISRYRMGVWYNLFLANLINNHRGKSTFRSIIDGKIKKEVSKKLYYFLRIISYPLFIKIYNFILLRVLGQNKEIQKILKKHKPSIIIYPTVLSGPFVCELPREAKKLNIKSIFCMNSWDNPMSKAIPNFFPDYLIVWGNDSKQQSVDLLKVPEERIKCFGAAQFEIYKQKSLLTRTELKNKFQVPYSKKYILYAGVGESYRETKYLKLLEEAINSKILENCHIIYRPHPWRGKLQEEEENFFHLKFRHITMDPHMIRYYKKEIKKPSRTFFMIDYTITRDLLNLVDGVVSPRSTVLLEGTLLGKRPFVIFPEEDHNLSWSKENIHFKAFCDLPNVITCFKISSFSEKIKAFNKKIYTKNLEKKIIKNSQNIVLNSKLGYAEQLNNLIIEIS